MLCVVVAQQVITAAHTTQMADEAYPFSACLSPALAQAPLLQCDGAGTKLTDPCLKNESIDDLRRLRATWIRETDECEVVTLCNGCRKPIARSLQVVTNWTGWRHWT